jgi:creatinine amidohydrolase
VRLDTLTWIEAEAAIARRPAAILPLGSIEQHGPIGLIGTDAFCAEDVATAAGARAGVLVAPTLAYAPAPFNMGFPGTLSVSAETFARLLGDVLDALAHHGVRAVYLLNAHGANLAPAAEVCAARPALATRLRSWWGFEAVNRLRAEFYGDWEGMHATPAEIAITRVARRTVPGDPPPPEKLDAAFIRAHAGDRHGPPAEHRARFPDGRVGSHSALARREHGQALLAAAAEAVAADVLALLDGAPPVA